MLNYVADFETTIEENQSRVWAWGYCEVGNVDNFHYGTNIEEFMSWCAKKENKTVYFHNLKFDGEFIIHWLLSNGFVYSEQKMDKSFSTVISNMGAFYSIEVIFKKMNKKYNKVVFRDSHKKLPFSVDAIGKAFKLPIGKIEVDQDFYKRYRPIDHQLTELEVDYLRNDIQVVAMALGIQFEQNLTKMTVGGDALNSFKDTLGGDKTFKINFPVLPLNIDADIRRAYKGGFTYANPIHKGRDVKEGSVYDVNSLYPSVMYNEWLPYGMPLFFEGQYKEDDVYPLYVQKLRCEFKLKKDKIPTIQMKGNLAFIPTQYIENSGLDPVELILTSVDIALFFDHYDVYVHEWVGGWKFKQCKGVFNEYIDYWTKIKVENSKTKNALYTLAKLMLNSLYGKFAKNPDVTGKYPVLENGIVKYKLSEEKIDEPVYTAMGAFITSYARNKTIRSAQMVYSRFIYADTDSLHLLGTDIPDLDIHENELGKWCHEGNFERARFIGAKAYIEQFDGKLHVTCSGMPDTVKQFVTWDNFHVGFSSMGKLRPKHVHGGIVLEDSEFTLRERIG